MNTENTDVAKQIKSLKIWVAIGSIGFLLIGVAAITFSVAMTYMSEYMANETGDDACKNEPTSLTWDNGHELFEKGQIQELLKLAEERLKTHPNDANAYWYKAKVYYLEGKWDLAKENIKQTEYLSPNWRKEYTGPLLKNIEDLMRNDT